jgi:hypothetical protein
MLRRMALVRIDVSEEGMLRLIVTANDVPNSPILVILSTELVSSYESSVLTRATWRNISVDDILHNHRHDNLTPEVN